MSEHLTVLQDLIEPARAGFWGTTEKASSGHIPCRVVRNGDVAKDGYVPRNQLPVRWFTLDELERAQVRDGDVVLVSSGAYTGNAGIIVEEDDGLPVIASNFVRRLRPKTQVHSGWFFHLIRSNIVQKYVPAHTGGSAIPNLSNSLYRKCPVPFVPGEKIQRRIAEILSTVDKAIEQTEALIAKYQQIKAGLMHDLFTRGVTPDGCLRPTRAEAPHLYKDSPLGWIPKEWDCLTVDDLLAKTFSPMRSGPFGSSLLKDELVEEGIPFLGIDNIFVERFAPVFRRFVSRRKFVELIRYSVFPRDVIITIMGTVGRCCVVPDCVTEALSSKHLWTMTFDDNRLFPELVCWQLNHARWVKDWFTRYSQGAVMEAIQSSTLRSLRLPVPKIEEQKLILNCYRICSCRIEAEQKHMDKLRQQKHGLMHDLLTGRVRVKVGESEGKA